MKIVYITGVAPFGPHEAFFISEMVEWLRQGHELLVMPRQESGPIVQREGELLQKSSLSAPVFNGKIAMGALAQGLRRPLRSLGALGLLFNPRGAASLGLNLAVFPKGLWIGRLAKQWGADHIHAHWATTMATMAMIASETSGIPWSFTAHRGDIARSNLLSTKVSRAAFVRYISESGRKMAESLGVRHPPGKAAIIHMGVKTPACSPAAPAERPTPVILCPANLLPVKGHCWLLRAMAILKQRRVAGRLDIAGDGELMDSLRAEADALALGETVRFLGHRLNEEIIRRYEESAVDIMVLPSLDLGNNLHEGIPVSLMEAMAYGVPVVSTTTGGIPELLHDGAGVMVPPQDPLALADVLERLLSDPALRRRLGKAGRRRVDEEFALPTVIRQLSERIREAGRAAISRR